MENDRKDFNDPNFWTQFNEQKPLFDLAKRDIIFALGMVIACVLLLLKKKKEI